MLHLMKHMCLYTPHNIYIKYCVLQMLRVSQMCKPSNNFKKNPSVLWRNIAVLNIQTSQ